MEPRLAIAALTAALALGPLTPSRLAGMRADPVDGGHRSAT